MDKTGILKELQKIHEKLQDLRTVKEGIAQLEKKIDTIASQNANIQSAQIGGGSNLLSTSESAKSPEVYKGVKLTELPDTANSPQKYARRVISNLFSLFK
jgi:ABC-type Fe2+-enterobactin transport system substrate-binding protein